MRATLNYRSIYVVKTIILLIISNAFMNIAWYGHLKYRNEPLLLVILASWGIALFEYIFQVPANRIGSEKFTLAQLKNNAERITLARFTLHRYRLVHQPLRL